MNQDNIDWTGDSEHNPISEPLADKIDAILSFRSNNWREIASYVGLNVRSLEMSAETFPPEERKILMGLLDRYKADISKFYDDYSADGGAHLTKEQFVNMILEGPILPLGSLNYKKIMKKMEK